jgi:hypothetical protein
MHSQQFFHIILIWVLVTNARWIPSPQKIRTLVINAFCHVELSHFRVVSDSLTANTKRLPDLRVQKHCFPGLCSSPGIKNKLENTYFRKLNLFLSSDEGKETPAMMRSLKNSWPQSVDSFPGSLTKSWPQSLDTFPASHRKSWPQSLDTSAVPLGKSWPQSLGTSAEFHRKS